jgi:hypothetical protein
MMKKITQFWIDLLTAKVAKNICVTQKIVQHEMINFFFFNVKDYHLP